MYLIVNDIRNLAFGLAKASVYYFCKRGKQKFVMSFTIKHEGDFLHNNVPNEDVPSYSVLWGIFSF